MNRRRREGRTRLGFTRLGIRGKLNVLLLVPLAAVLVVAVPLVITQVDDARSSGRTADVAGRARDFGGLVWELQRERLLTAAYLADGGGDNTDLVRQHRAVDTAAAAAVDSLGSQEGDGADELSSALVRIGSLKELRQSALRRGVSPDAVARTYHAVIGAVIDALRLTPQRTSDAEGTRQLTVLDALLRANEEIELSGMALIATAMDPQTGLVLLENAGDQARMLIERFVQQADRSHADLVVDVDQGDFARRVTDLGKRLPLEASDNRDSFVLDALTAVQEHSAQRRVALEQVTVEVTAAARSRAGSAELAAWGVGSGAALLFIIVALLVIRVSRSISDPLRRLTAAATEVADLAETELVRVTDTKTAQEQTPRLAEIEVDSQDELGTLAAAFNRVQSTASMLVERQATTRRNVSLMFANVAQRTQNLVGRQMALVDELERDEQDVELLERLYRLDHVATRLRRSADNLLVVAGAQDHGRLSGPIELATALRAALAEIEDYQRVDLRAIADLTLSPRVGADLVLVFAELMENATSFSPPDSTVEVGAAFLADGSCVVTVTDHGIGLPPDKLAEENRRLIERERLDIVPTTVLGLFVVGRLARRHQLRVELVPTPGGGITAHVLIAPTLFTRPEVAPRTEDDGDRRIPELHIPPARQATGFTWFPGFADAAPEPASRPLVVRNPERGPDRTPERVPDRTPDHGPEPVQRRRPDEGSDSRGGLRRRVAGAQLPGSTAAPQPQAPPMPPAPAAQPAPFAPPARGTIIPPTQRPRHDPAAARAALDAFDSGFARAAGPPPEAVRRGGLSRRVPGESLAPGLRKADLAPAAPIRAERRVRDPDKERAMFDTFATGLARAASAGPDAMPGGNPRPDADPRRESTV